MGLYERVLQSIINKKERKEKGLHNGIPFPFERYKDYIPSIDKGSYIGILGSSGIGKSRWIRDAFVYKTLEFSKKNNYPVKILYFALEDGDEAIYKKMMIHYLYTRHHIDISAKYLDSKDVPIPDKYLNYLKQDADFYKEFDESVYIINNCSSPSEIQKVSHELHKKYGETHHLIAIIDNYSNITKDAHHNTEWEAIKTLSRNVIRLDLCKKLNMTVVAVLQVDAETEKHTFRNAGKVNLSAVEPNISSIGDAKVIMRDRVNILTNTIK